MHHRFIEYFAGLLPSYQKVAPSKKTTNPKDSAATGEKGSSSAFASRGTKLLAHYREVRLPMPRRRAQLRTQKSRKSRQCCSNQRSQGCRIARWMPPGRPKGEGRCTRAKHLEIGWWTCREVEWRHLHSPSQENGCWTWPQDTIQGRRKGDLLPCRVVFLPVVLYRIFNARTAATSIQNDASSDRKLADGRRVDVDPA